MGKSVGTIEFHHTVSPDRGGGIFAAEVVPAFMYKSRFAPATGVPSFQVGRARLAYHERYAPLPSPT
jgi:hypothetical protein